MNRRMALAGLTLTVAAPLGLLNLVAVPSGARDRQRSAPAKAGFANVHGSQFYYEIYGDVSSMATPLLVMHGSFMSSAAMGPLIEPIAGKHPIIAFDARGHGRTGNLPGPFTYKQMAADAVGILDALKVPVADVLGYSMGAVTALGMAVRFPDRVGKQVIVSGVSQREGWHPEVREAIAHITAAAMAGGPLTAEYKRLSPTPDAFPILVGQIRDQGADNYDHSDEAIRSIKGKTMIIVGDSDAVQFEHALKLFRLRGGGDKKVLAQGFLSESPRARLAILPATSHIGIMANAAVIGEFVIPFLDDKKPALPDGIL